MLEHGQYIPCQTTYSFLLETNLPSAMTNRTYPLHQHKVTLEIYEEIEEVILVESIDTYSTPTNSATTTTVDKKYTYYLLRTVDVIIDHHELFLSGQLYQLSQLSSSSTSSSGTAITSKVYINVTVTFDVNAEGILTYRVDYELPNQSSSTSLPILHDHSARGGSADIGGGGGGDATSRSMMFLLVLYSIFLGIAYLILKIYILVPPPTVTNPAASSSSSSFDDYSMDDLDNNVTPYNNSVQEL
jgi:hypothetical protein